jgi:hypothetical protein
VLCAYDASFGAGLLEAMTQVTVDGESLLLVAYDTEYPEPIHAKRPMPDAFAVALVLTPQPGPGSLARLELDIGQAPADNLADWGLERLRLSIPAARCLPILQRLAHGGSGVAVVDYLDLSRLQVSIEPCT